LVVPVSALLFAIFAMGIGVLLVLPFILPELKLLVNM
jgi:hypothetical protein